MTWILAAYTPQVIDAEKGYGINVFGKRCKVRVSADKVDEGHFVLVHIMELVLYVVQDH